MSRRQRRSSRRLRHLTALCALAAMLAHPAPAASLSAQDLQIIASALAFVRPPPSDESVVAIVHDGRDNASRRDAEAILAAIGTSLAANGALLTPRLVGVDELNTIGFSLVIVATGANGETVSRAARARRVLCVTADQMAVRQGLCTMAIRSTVKVDILLNHRAALASGLTIATAFRMMVGEL